MTCKGNKFSHNEWPVTDLLAIDRHLVSLERDKMTQKLNGTRVAYNIA